MPVYKIKISQILHYCHICTECKEMRKLRCTTFETKPTAASEIQNIIKTLKPNDSYGYNEISNKVLKVTAPFISSPLHYICNKVITEGVFPDRLKYSVIRPLYKEGNN